MSATQILSATATDVIDGRIEMPTGDLDDALQKMQVKRRKNKKEKDPNAPKRAASAYMLWLNENRAAIKDELLTTNPDAKITDVTKRAGELWKELGDEQKAPFQAQSDELRTAYHEAMKAYKPDHAVAKKTKAPKVKYDVDEMPDAPQDWTGPHKMHHLLRKVAGIDGKTVRIQKNFDAAVALANEINAAWTAAVENGDVPSHWKTDVKPCAGITKTSTGYDLRLGPDLVQTQEKDAKGGLASWTIADLSAPAHTSVDADEHESPVVHDQKPKTPDAPKKKRGRKPKTQDLATEPAAEPASEPAAEPASEPAKKKVMKVKAKTSPKKPMVTVDDCLEIEIERNGEDVTLLLHEDSGNVFATDNLFAPVATASDDGIQFL